jgi:RNA polymerase sigma-70 factor (ECF subfamily)
MTEEMLGLGDPVIRRLQQAFAHEEPATELAAILQRAAQYQAGEPPENNDALAPHHGLTAADLVAARRREPAAVTRIYTAYAPALFRFFMAAVGDRHQAEDLTGTTFVSAIEDLPRFYGPVEALGGWLFQIARHDLYDHRRRQARARIEPLEDHLPAVAAAAGAANPAELAIERLEGSRVLAALRELSPDPREVLLLRMGAGLTAPEVAETLGKTTGAVKALQHRGLASLARVLGGLRSPHQAQDRPYPPPDPARLPSQEEEER